ncbi:hypothetical protein EON63_07445 [archaeon]|nr:MAG: hypothetical protein EON63_07445 [archaeon]
MCLGRGEGARQQMEDSSRSTRLPVRLGFRVDPARTQALLPLVSILQRKLQVTLTTLQPTYLDAADLSACVSMDI